MEGVGEVLFFFFLFVVFALILLLLLLFSVVSLIFSVVLVFQFERLVILEFKRELEILFKVLLKDEKLEVVELLDGGSMEK